MAKMNCPLCDATMEPTYEPYELRCPCCGYWYDLWTGKEINSYDDYTTALVAWFAYNPDALRFDADPTTRYAPPDDE